MTGFQNSKIQMCYAVKASCDAQAAVFATFPPFAAPFTDFCAALLGLDTIIGQQGTKTQGVTQVKTAQRRDLEAITILVTASLVLHGSINGIPLGPEAHTPPSEVKKMKDMLLVGHADKIGALAATLTPAELATVKLTAGNLTDLEARRVAFRDSTGQPRQKKMVSKDATGALEKKIEELDNYLEQMDNAANVLQFTEPSFYSQYTGAREIIDPGYSTRQLTVRINATSNGEAIEGVEAIINPGNIKKLSGPAGMFFINNMPAGSYSMMLTSKSHQAKTEQFNIAANQSTIVDVEMVPNP